MSYLSPESEYTPREAGEGRRLNSQAARLARALIHGSSDVNEYYTKRPAIMTPDGPASVTVPRFGNGPMETPHLLGAVFVSASRSIVVETHALFFPFDSGFKTNPNIWCGAARIVMAEVVLDEGPSDVEPVSIYATRHLEDHLIGIERTLDRAYRGACGYGNNYSLPADPRTDPDAYQITRAFMHYEHTFEHPSLNLALCAIQQPE